MTVEKTAVTAVAGLMAIAARTAPKAKGQDEILISVLTSARQKELSRAMTDYGTQHGLGFFLRDAKNVAASDACLVVGVRGNVSVGINCGACGYATCAALEKATQKKRPTTTAFAGPNCAGTDGGSWYCRRVSGKDRPDPQRGQPDHVYRGLGCDESRVPRERL